MKLTLDQFEEHLRSLCTKFDLLPGKYYQYIRGCQTLPEFVKTVAIALYTKRTIDDTVADYLDELTMHGRVEFLEETNES
jgi:trans-aconitate methyltransferase